MSAVRDLKFAVGWDINDRPLRRADKATDRHIDSVGKLGREISTVGNDGERAFSLIERSAHDADDSIRGIQSPDVSSNRSVGEMANLSSAADDASQNIRGIPDPAVSYGQSVWAL